MTFSLQHQRFIFVSLVLPQSFTPPHRKHLLSSTGQRLRPCILTVSRHCPCHTAACLQTNQTHTQSCSHKSNSECEMFYSILQNLIQHTSFSLPYSAFLFLLLFFCKYHTHHVHQKTTGNGNVLTVCILIQTQALQRQRLKYLTVSNWSLINQLPSTCIEQS